MSDPISDPATMSGSQPENYTINCLLKLGDDISVLQIKIASNESVAALKDWIKEKKPNGLNNIDADTLKLYRIDMIYDKNLVDNVNRKMAENPAELDNPTMDLSEIFSETPKKKMVHILVKAPEIRK
ncbi:hypothetical protein CPB86DRAFT_477979 [Serendipita vermifera]|nr:hypothetical protein CPB86DRAFT_477979 [Serendipita vermifera]